MVKCNECEFFQTKNGFGFCLAMERLLNFKPTEEVVCGKFKAKAEAES
jgi:hypothetical protein